MTFLCLARSLAAAPSRVCGVATRKNMRMSTLLSADYEFPGLPSLSPQLTKATSISATTLPNGVTVVSEDASTTSTVTLTYTKAGTGNEFIDEQGAAFLNKCMNFKSGSGISTLLINRTIEDAGGTPFSNVDRAGATLGFSVTPEKAISLIPLLATDCSFEKWDVRDAKAFASLESKVANESAQIVLTESLYAAAHGPQSPAGRPLYWSDCSVNAIKAFRARAYGLNGAVLAATGIKDHSSFCTEVETVLSASPAGDATPSAAVSYIGGESRVSAPALGYAHVAVAFKSSASTVVNNIIVQLLNIAGLESGITGFTTYHGLVGAYGGSVPSSGLVDAICGVVKSSSAPGAYKRAKNRAKAEALFALDGGSKSLANMMTLSVLESGTFTSPSDVAKAYDCVTDKDIAAALAAMLKSNPSVAAVGDISLVPYQATIAANLK